MVLKNQKGGAACHFRRPKTWGVLALIFPDVTCCLLFVIKRNDYFRNHATLVKEIYSLLSVSIAQQFRCNSFNSADNSFWIKLMIFDKSQNPEAIEDWRMERTSLDPEIRVRTFRRQLSRKKSKCWHNKKTESRYIS